VLDFITATIAVTECCMRFVASPGWSYGSLQPIKGTVNSRH